MCSGRPSKALRGITVPDVIDAGPLKRSAIASGITIVAAVPPALVRLRRFVPVFPYGDAEMLAL